MKRLIIFTTSLLTLIQTVVFPVTPAFAIETCDDLKVVFADGSGAEINGTDNNYLDFKTAITAVLEPTGLSYDFYELGSIGYGGYKYPAVAIGDSLEGINTAVEAFFSAGGAYDYGESVAQGVGDLKSYLEITSTKCPNTKFVLGGYSQGAGVISTALPFLDSEKIIYAATFGDAKLYLPEGEGLYPDACLGKNLSPYRAYVPDCRVYEGILGGLKPYSTSDFTDKLGAWCNYYDVICSSRIDWTVLPETISTLDIVNTIGTPHASYGNSGNADHLYEDAAAVIAEKIAETYNLEHTSSRQNVAILIDTTGSMRGLIDNYIDEAYRLASQVLDNGGVVALYDYRDINEDIYLPRMICNFQTCSKEVIQSELNALMADGGGDTLESFLPAAWQAMKDLAWEQGAVKSIVALTDAGYHPIEEYDGQILDDAAIIARSLEIDPVNIFTLTPNDTMSEYSEITTKTGGKAFSTASELTASTNFILSRPDTKLSLASYSGHPGDEFYFDASATTSESSIIKYDWDLDFDGIFETTTTVPYTTKIYSIVTSGTIQVKATDTNGLFSTMSATVQVTAPTSTQIPTIDNISYTNNADGSVTINLSTDASRLTVSANNFLLGSTSKTNLTITDLESSVGNTLSFTPFNLSGDAGEAATIYLPPTDTSTPISDQTDSTQSSPTDPNISSPLPSSDLNSQTAFLNDFTIAKPPKNSTNSTNSTIFIPKAPNSGFGPLSS